MNSSTAQSLARLRRGILPLLSNSPALASVSVPAPVRITALRETECRSMTPSSYEPVICLILQGEKVIEFGSERLVAGPGSSVVVSHLVPIRSAITAAAAEEPYLAVIVPLDLGTLRSLAAEVDLLDVEPTSSPAITVVPSADPVVDAAARLVALADHPDDASVIAPLVHRELHYRLLTSEHGAVLRHLLAGDSRATAITVAIADIRSDLAAPLSVPELARSVHMSPSTFHKHFRAVTATTPLQFQKSLRLLHARELLQDTGRSVTDVAFEVAYRSPTQFSREYGRTFGMTPREDRPTVAAD
jgi:AraC-like DNA-binding protein